MNIWRLGTNWGGTPTLDVILATKVGFFSTDWPIDGVEVDDIIAIATPKKYTVEAIGIAASKVLPLSGLLDQQEQAGVLSQWIDDAKGFRFKKIWTIPKEMQFSTSDYKQFYSLRNDPNAWNNALKIVNLMQSEEKMKELCQLLDNCYNLILTGAPGTGKTYLAMEIADALTGAKDTPANKHHTCFVQFHPSYDYTDFVEGLRPTKPDENSIIGFEYQDGIFKEFCKKAIESTINARKDNFEEAWQRLVDWLEENEFAKVESLNGKVTFEVELNEYGNGLATRNYATEADRQNHIITPGNSRYYNKEQLYRVYRGLAGVPNGGHDNYRKAVLKMMMKKFGLSEYTPGSEVDTPSKPKYVFIIDEINRGDIAKIFGELFFALDPGYRGKKEHRVRSPYYKMIDNGDVFKDGFYIPDNVYVIGTMNDIDRNVESMDFAIRRRFTWKRITPEDTQDTILSKLGANAEEAKKRMNRLNAVIRNEKVLGENFCIGAAYFAKLDNNSDKWNKLWKYHLEPLLEEYVRGLPESSKLMDTFRKAYDGTQANVNTAAQG